MADQDQQPEHDPSTPRPEGSLSEGGFVGLRAMYVNCTLKPSPEQSHTQGLIDASAEVMTGFGVEVEHLRAVDHRIAPGVQIDMTEHGAAASPPTATWPAPGRRAGPSAEPNPLEAGRRR